MATHGKKEKLIIAVQGIGNVGYNFALLAEKTGFKIMAISDSKGAIVETQNVKHKTQNHNLKLKTWQSLNLERVIKWKEKTGSVVGFPGTKTITNEELLELPVDVLAPAALENVITAKNASRIQAKIILELANGPITSEASEILLKKKKIIVPDVLANSGGVTVSYFEWVQNLSGYRWPLIRVNQELKEHLDKAFSEIWQLAGKEGLDLRTAAYLVALKKIFKATELRGKETL